MEIDDEKLRSTISDVIAERFDYIFGININNSESRLKALNAMQLMLEDGRIEDLNYLRKLRVGSEEKDSQLRKTFWDSVRQFISPILTAMAAALASWLTFHR